MTNRVSASTGLLIHGGPPASQAVDVRNPADTAHVVATYPLLGPAHVDAAVEAAHGAQPEWASCTAAQRLKALRAAADEIAAIPDLAQTLVREQGKVLAEAGMEAGYYGAAVESFAPYADWLDRDEDVVTGPMGHFVVHNGPVGVAGLISPSNWPVSLSLLKLVPALLAGNGAILVPAPTTPLAITEVVRVLSRHLPDGLVSVLTSPDTQVARRLVEHPGVPAISFTGGTRTGASVGAVAGGLFKRVTLELGGNDAALILAGQPIDEALIGGLMLGAFLTAGQVCMAIKRIYAPADMIAPLAQALGAALDQSVTGDGLDPASTLGPLHTAAQTTRLAGLIAEARAAGADVRECGTMTGDPARGHFVRPSVAVNVPPQARLVQEEQFAPCLPLVGYDDLDQAIAMVNDSPYGLCSSVWSPDVDRAAALALQIEAGVTYVNSHLTHDLAAPFGGVKNSGVGREYGAHGVRSFTEPHTIRLPA
ncbi:MAG TPA: aldehyde dehydrogenase family protein [Streptosporangiaceae bacterium]|jgi:acyl-CoA reductase-like NAD-dependent aldehyde dehydrogenase